MEKQKPGKGVGCLVVVVIAALIVGMIMICSSVAEQEAEPTPVVRSIKDTPLHPALVDEYLSDMLVASQSLSQYDEESLITDADFSEYCHANFEVWRAYTFIRKNRSRDPKFEHVMLQLESHPVFGQTDVDGLFPAILVDCRLGGYLEGRMRYPRLLGEPRWVNQP